MLGIYLKSAVRNFRKNMTYSLINVIGLSIGMAVALLISFWVWDEWSFNKSNKNYERVAKVMVHSRQNGLLNSLPDSPFPLAQELRNSFSGDFEHVAISWTSEPYNLLSGDRKFRKEGRFIEPEGAFILSPKMIEGSLNALSDPTSIFISESAANSIFGTGQALGRSLKIDNELLATVAGIYVDFPSNSDYKDLDFIAPWKLFTSAGRRQWVKELTNNWDTKTFELLVQTREQSSVEKASEKIRNIFASHSKAGGKRSAQTAPLASLQPMGRWHLYSTWENGADSGGRIYYVRVFALTGIFILLLACINFINLTTARAQRRAREVGVRKAVGSMRRQLILQFMTESLWTVSVAFVFSLVMVGLALPAFNAITGKQITFLHLNGLGSNLFFPAAGLVVCVLVSVVAGGYPALYLSSFKPVTALKSGRGQIGHASVMPRRFLIVAQYVVSVALIIGTLGVFRQIQLGKERHLGYDQNGLVNVQLPPGSGKLDALKDDLLKTRLVTSVAQSSGPVTDVLSNARGFYWQGKPGEMQEEFAVIAASHSYGHTHGRMESDPGTGFFPRLRLRLFGHCGE